MHFDFSTPIKKSKKHSQPIKLNLYTTLTKDIYCVAGINLDGSYYAIDIQNGNKYLLTSKSYYIKTRIYYSQQLINNKRLQICTLNAIKEFNNPWLYLPFAPGVGLFGNIVKSNYNENQIWFDLSRTFDMPRDNELSRNEFLYYRENYKEIYNNILTKYNARESFCDDQ